MERCGTGSVDALFAAELALDSVHTQLEGTRAPNRLSRGPILSDDSIQERKANTVVYIVCCIFLEMRVRTYAPYWGRFLPGTQSVPGAGSALPGNIESSDS